MLAQKLNRSGGVALLTTLCLATVIDIGVGWWLGRPAHGQNARIAVALLPIPANLLLIALVVRAIRKLDDFLRQVHLEAVAIAFLLTGLAVFVYGYLEMASAVGRLNVATVWVFMAIFYGIGYLIAVRHYR
jgi:uncharacterized membrane protein